MLGPRRVGCQEGMDHPRRIKIAQACRSVKRSSDSRRKQQLRNRRSDRARGSKRRAMEEISAEYGHSRKKELRRKVVS